MNVRSDTGPLHYLVLIDAVDVLPSLYHRVIVSRTVAIELEDAAAPAAVRSWIAHPPIMDRDSTGPTF